MGVDLTLMVMDDTEPKWSVAYSTKMTRDYNDHDALGFGSAVHTTPLKFQPVPQEKYTGGDGYSDTLVYVPARALREVVEKLSAYNRENVDYVLATTRSDQPVIFFWS